MNIDDLHYHSVLSTQYSVLSSTLVTNTLSTHHPLLILAIISGKVHKQMMRSAIATLQRNMLVGTLHRRKVRTTEAMRRLPSAPTTATIEISTCN